MGEDSNGHCCDGFRASNRKCSGLCRTKFRVCLKHYQSRINVEDECTFGEVYTQILGNNNIFVRTTPIQFPLDFKWPGTFSLIIEALHDNGHNNSGKKYIFFFYKKIFHQKDFHSKKLFLYNQPGCKNLLLTRKRALGNDLSRTSRES